MHNKDIIKRMDNGEIKKLLSVVDLRKAIPVAKGCYHKIDIRTHKDRDLLAKEYEFCKRKKDTIFNKTKSIISQQKRTNNIKFAYCNYSLLEEKMNEWNDSH
ncbi:type III toxin-antitoxin system ToxN/AbiQ family toxin [Amedibacillus dolichus]|uniref:type III toxin-antitoxin system ToxN/AbiQ family toxin n=1 Tax=Amedibacillus dolichus TaxID=31971 RepID=UPI0035BE9F15